MQSQRDLQFKMVFANQLQYRSSFNMMKILLMRAQTISHCLQDISSAHKQAAGGEGGRENVCRSEGALI